MRYIESSCCGGGGNVAVIKGTARNLTLGKSCPSSKRPRRCSQLLYNLLIGNELRVTL